MRRGVTMIELIFALTIIAIIASVSTDVVRLVFEKYVASRELERGQSDVRRTLDLLAARLQYRIKNSAIGRNENETVSLDSLDLSTDYNVLEWIGIAYESQRGMDDDPDDADNTVKPGWSGLAVQTTENYTFETPGSYLQSVASPIEEALAGADPFTDQLTVLVFAGEDGRGSYTGLQSESWGWNLNDHNSSYFAIALDSQTGITLTPLEPDNAAPVSSHYYLARSAYALWVNEGNLTLAYNYRPWLGQDFQTHGTHAVLLENVTTFHFRESGGVLRLVLCVQADERVAGEAVEFCRERTVF